VVSQMSGFALRRGPQQRSES